MKRSALVAATLVVGILSGFAADRLLDAQQPQEQIRRTSLMQTELEGVPGKVADVFLIEFAPEAATGKHSHPGNEIAYILEGTATVLAGGNMTPITQRRGSVIHIEPNMVHDVKNPSKTEPLKAIVFALTSSPATRMDGP